MDDRIDWDAARKQLSEARGRDYWRSLNELAETEEFTRWVDDEFPNRATLLQIDRRNFLRFMGASLALAGLAGCRALPEQQIVPYVNTPEGIVPGKALQFATAVTLGGYATGVLATSNMGRPTKIEGNPDHPASLGSTDVFAQASVLNLYDPSRAKDLTKGGQVNTWDAFLRDVRGELTPDIGVGLRILTGAVTSPTLESQISSLVARYPGARWHRWEPVNRDNARAGAVLAFGEPVETVYRFDHADVVLTLDGDFLTTLPGHVRYARDFAAKRDPRLVGPNICRLYALECTPTLTGAMADHRLAIQSQDLLPAAAALARLLGVEAPQVAPPSSVPQTWLAALAADLRAAAGRSVVVVGDSQPPAVHVLAHAINFKLGNVGRTVVYTDPIEADSVAHVESIGELTRDINAGKVRFLLIVGGNPAYDAPAELGFKEALDKVSLAAYVGLHDNETADECEWLVPDSHSLEAWSDARAFDGTVTIVQPLIEPLYQTHSVHEVFAALLGQSRDGYDIIRAHWQSVRKVTGPEFERWWRKAVHDGVVAGTAAAPKAVRLRPGLASAIGAIPARVPGIEINFRPDSTIWDGRFAENGWLQELPKQLTKLTWDNAAILGPRTARRLGLAQNDMVELRLGDRAVTAAVWVQPGHTDDAVTAHLGYGRTRGGQVSSGAGFNAYPLRASDRLWSAAGLQLRKLSGSYNLVTTQDHFAINVRDIGDMGYRDLVHNGTVAEYVKDPSLKPAGSKSGEPMPSLYPPYQYKDNAWGMAIDLNLCIGCNACEIACQAENNIPVIGKEEVNQGRIMHWIRIDRYFKGDPADPRILHQPVPCMQCEQAPCEPVCPVGATLHDHEGLNMMVYNRCIGTRYCSNNCPYKVRRFNFYKYTAGQPNNAPGNYDIPVMQLSANPNVTVRGRGVMEKCTYCVQRISAARIAAKEAGRPIADGEVVTACQQACPTKAITFGNINDPKSEIAAARKLPRNYTMLEDLDTRPRTTYLAKLTNPNAEIETE